MQHSRQMIITLACTAFVSVSGMQAKGQSISEGQPVKIQGVIASRNGPDMTVKEPDGTSVVAVLNDYTEVKLKEGHFGFRKKQVDVTLLLPGLHIELQGTGTANGQVTAGNVTFTERALQAARDIQGGTSVLTAQQQQLSAQEQNLKAEQSALAAKEQKTQQAAEQAQQTAALANQRIDNLNKYATKYNADVYFGVDKTALSEEAKTTLSQLASEALTTNAYMIQVAGYASKTGSAQLNEELSNERADAVIAYLTQSGHIPLFRVLAPAAMGASTSAGTDAALNRRVSVKVVVNEGIAQ